MKTDDGQNPSRQKGKSENCAAEFSLAGGHAGSARPVVTVDVDRYQFWLEGTELSPSQKEEVMQSLWLIVMTFVELGFGVHPAQSAYASNSTGDAVEPETARDTGSSGSRALHTYQRLRPPGSKK
ncbi:hypothetical protein RWK44_05370 [Rhizobium sp. 25PS6]|jgi:hypothetical protein|uniref:hypothetical protein n=1 Tax=Rhizobium TaxID=379 RepID=UPI00102F3816|nr:MULTISPECIES: hypothetical protein [Rhizobium]MBY3476175.1 hypothetical protein [Rhizobium laguerreae]MBY3524288.1 hypothetical protein [Rhizobium laguerreae]MDU0359840.1 hypothetical protein [Rhizobium sp. 25PS6]TBB53894.1 hypothetical protein ELH44_09525 [Rhizobium ruizarguesonis]TBZ36420.1 hypothetical protein E0H36_05160 [Rhizobium leguminosarum bv. viciae]